MAKLYQISCPKCNNKTDLFRYGEDVQLRKCPWVSKVSVQEMSASVG